MYMKSKLKCDSNICALLNSNLKTGIRLFSIVFMTVSSHLSSLPCACVHLWWQPTISTAFNTAHGVRLFGCTFVLSRD